MCVRVSFQNDGARMTIVRTVYLPKRALSQRISELLRADGGIGNGWVGKRAEGNSHSH
jgi:hypothetical protein